MSVFGDGGHVFAKSFLFRDEQPSLLTDASLPRPLFLLFPGLRVLGAQPEQGLGAAWPRLYWPPGGLALGCSAMVLLSCICGMDFWDLILDPPIYS